MYLSGSSGCESIEKLLQVDIKQQPTYTILLVGPHRSGKTLFLKTILSTQNSKYTEPPSITAIMEGYEAMITVDESRKVLVRFVDIPSGEKYSLLVQDVLKLVDGIVFIYDASQLVSSISKYAQDLSKTIEKVREKKSLGGVVVANVRAKQMKRNAPRDFGYFIAKALMQGNVLPYYEISVKDKNAAEVLLSKLVLEMDKARLETRYSK